jgi:hypothetical protein
MARKIGGSFLHAAHGPVAFAVSCLSQNQIAKGLEELAVDGLAGGIDRGALEVARIVGVPLREVQAFLPADELARVARRIEQTQPAALEAWRRHAGPFGILDLVTQLTVDGRAVDARLALERLAAKVKADKALAKPLLELAEDVGAWEELVYRCASLLDDGEGLSKAYRLRRQRQLATAVAAIFVMLGALGAIAWTAIARSRISEALRSPDPCAALGITERDRGMASNEQDAAIAAAERRCGDERREEAAAKEREAREREAREAAERAAAARLAKCKALARGIAAGKLDAEAGDAATPLARRVAERQLEASDLGPAEEKIPCWRDGALASEGDGSIDRAFVDAVLALPGGWPGVIDASPRTASLLEARAEDLPAWQKTALAARAAREADRALVAGQPDEVARARRTCALAERLGVPGGVPCTAIASLPEP